jgi:hypothetical protein
VAGEHRRRQRVEDTAARLESEVYQAPHPPGVDALVNRVDWHEPAGVSAVSYRRRIVYDLDIPGRKLQTVLALHLARDYHPGVRNELVQ